MLNILKIYLICIVIYHSYNERMKINKCSKLVCKMHDKNNYVVHIGSLKQGFDHGIILKNVHRVI